MRSITAASVRCALGSTLGISSILLWCTLMGHTPGFLLSSAGMGSWANARIFWLIGILAMAAAFVIAPRFFKLRDHAMAFVLPILSATSIGCFALSFHQDFLPPALLAIGGLIVSGAGYFWFGSRFTLLLARTRPFSFVVVCIAAAFPVRQICSLALDAAMPAEMQVIVATTLPLIAALCFEFARRNAGERMQGAPDAARKAVFGVRGHARRVAADRRSAADIIVLMVAAAILLSIVRAFGISGTWGNSRFVYFSDLGYGMGLLVTVACLAAFSGIALIAMAEKPLAIRFQPAILIVIAGLFVMASQAGAEETTTLASSLIEIDDPFAHLLFWCVVAVALDMLRVPSYRVIGIPGAVYGACSIAWVGIVEAGPVDNGIILGTIYLLIVMAVGYLWIGSHRALAPTAQGGEQRESAKRAGGGLIRAADKTLAENAPEADAAFGAAAVAGDVESTIAARCEAIAREYRLTARETEVFTLLAQGRTRAFIVEELVLSDNTVKTHVSHIYGKLGVHDRQGMMDLVLGSD